MINYRYSELFEQADDKYAVMCVQHDYKVTESTKMDGQNKLYIQNWSHGTMELWTS